VFYRLIHYFGVVRAAVLTCAVSRNADDIAFVDQDLLCSSNVFEYYYIEKCTTGRTLAPSTSAGIFEAISAAWLFSVPRPRFRQTVLLV